MIMMRACILMLALTAMLAATGSAYAELEVFTSSSVYVEGQPLVVQGRALPGENVIVRLFTPDDTIAKFDQVTAAGDGSFDLVVITWPEASATFPFGTYLIEAIATRQEGITASRDVKFTSSEEIVSVPVERHVNAAVFVPETAVIGMPLRVFVQTTSDGLLIQGEPSDLLETTHVHLPDNQVEPIAGSFETLHQGLYFADYTPSQLGTHVFHVVMFHQGTVSHASAATTIQSHDIRGIAEEIVELNDVLDDTSGELDRLELKISEFASSLESASEKIDSSVSSMSTSVANIEEASIQLNSLLFPIVGAIAIIVALQIVILARR